MTEQTEKQSEAPIKNNDELIALAKIRIENLRDQLALEESVLRNLEQNRVSSIQATPEVSASSGD